MSAVRIAFDAAVSFLYPPKCALCGLASSSAICFACSDTFRRFDPEIRVLPGLDYLASVYVYEGRAAQAVLRLKFERVTSLAAPMSAILAAQMSGLGLVTDLVVPVPIHWTRRCFRGFNQAELLVAEFAKVSGGLDRVKATRPQVRLSPSERIQNLAGAFWARPEVCGQRVLLVDDVTTSGRTLQECARALREAGAIEIGALTFAGAWDT